MTRRISFFCLTFLSIYILPPSSFGQLTNKNADSIQVANTMTEFINVFSNLEWDKFIEFFSDSATAFFPPSSKYPYRANNKIEIEKIFKNFFENTKRQKLTGPYLIIKPKDLKIQLLNSIAIVTFMLDDPNLFGRRTFILEKHNDKWLIIHLHASGVPLVN